MVHEDNVRVLVNASLRCNDMKSESFASHDDQALGADYPWWAMDRIDKQDQGSVVCITIATTVP